MVEEKFATGLSEAGRPPLWVAATITELGRLRGVALGVGPLVAGVEMTRVIHALRPSAVVLVGTAGRYENAPPEGEVVQGRRLGWGHAAVPGGLGYVPAPPPALEADSRLRGRIGLPEADVLTVGAITTHREVARHFGESWQVEHMEAYGAALACAREGVPFACVLGIANVVGPDAHAEWVANHVRVERLVQDVMLAVWPDVHQDT